MIRNNDNNNDNFTLIFFSMAFSFETKNISNAASTTDNRFWISHLLRNSAENTYFTSVFQLYILNIINDKTCLIMQLKETGRFPYDESLVIPPSP